MKKIICFIILAAFCFSCAMTEPNSPNIIEENIPEGMARIQVLNTEGVVISDELVNYIEDTGSRSITPHLQGVYTYYSPTLHQGSNGRPRWQITIENDTQLYIDDLNWHSNMLYTGQTVLISTSFNLRPGIRIISTKWPVQFTAWRNEKYRAIGFTVYPKRELGRIYRMTQIGNGSSDNRLAVVSYDNNVVVRVGSSVKTLNAGQVYYFGAVNAGTSIKTDNPNHTIACYAWCYSKYWTRGVTLAPLD